MELDIKKLSQLIAKSGTQKDFAQKVGTTQSAVCKHLKGEMKPKPTTIIRYANALDVRVADIIVVADSNREQSLTALMTALWRVENAPDDKAFKNALQKYQVLADAHYKLYGSEPTIESFADMEDEHYTF